MLRKNKTKKRKFFVVFSVLTMILVMTCCVYAIASVMAEQRADAFAQEADAYFASFAPQQTTGSPTKEIEQTKGSPYQFALQYPTTGNTSIDTSIAAHKDTHKNAFVTYYENLRKKQTNDSEKPSKHYTLFLSYTANTTKDHITSIAFHEQYQSSNSDTTFAYWTPYLYDTESGKELTHTDIFRGDDYRQIASRYLIDYFQNQTELSEQLYTNYETTLAPESEIYDHFGMTDDAILFYIDQYKILPQNYGAIYVSVPRITFSGHYTTDPVPAQAICDPVTGENAHGIKADQKMVALTFDDGPSPIATNRILDTLEKYGVVATFYDVGVRVAQHPEVVKREAASGSDVASHSYDHKDFAKMTPEQIQDDVKRTAEAFAAAGVVPSSFRPPYGSTNATVEANIPMPIVTWSIDTLDWKSRDANAILNQVAAAGNLDGKVLLFHGIYDSTAEAIEILVPKLIEEGYQLVTISELITYRHQETPQNGKVYGYSYFQ